MATALAACLLNASCVCVHNPGPGRPSGSSNRPIETIPSWPIHKTAQGDGKLTRRRPPTRSGGADRSSRSSVQPANANGPPPLVVLPADFSGLRTHESAEESTSSVSCYFTTHIFPFPCIVPCLCFGSAQFLWTKLTHDKHILPRKYIEI
jgi:hypothetical protein